MAKGDKWELLTTAPDQLAAEIWADILKQAGVPAMVHPADAVSFLGVSGLPCRLMVASGYKEKAREILAGLKPEEEIDDGEE